VQGDRGPDRFDILLPDAAAAQEVTGGIRAINFKALFGAAVPGVSPMSWNIAPA
jgi:hypothetical protein